MKLSLCLVCGGGGAGCGSGGGGIGGGRVHVVAGGGEEGQQSRHFGFDGSLSPSAGVRSPPPIEASLQSIGVTVRTLD